ncbi:MAG: hypothetical protein K2H96_05200 [Muribaculaceae bacterium]|nr:hypothetical protein [Muribaculaceae bacterium]
MEVLLIVFLVGIFVLALLVASAVISRIRNNSTNLLSDFDRMSCHGHSLNQ